jgi:hypothetical protein
MPGLNLMTENEADGGMVFFKSREEVLERVTQNLQSVYLVELVEHNLAVGTDVVNPKFNGVSSGFANSMTCKSRIESHIQLID